MYINQEVLGGMVLVAVVIWFLGRIRTNEEPFEPTVEAKKYDLTLFRSETRPPRSNRVNATDTVSIIYDDVKVDYSDAYTVANGVTVRNWRSDFFPILYNVAEAYTDINTYVAFKVFENKEGAGTIYLSDEEYAILNLHPQYQSMMLGWRKRGFLVTLKKRGYTQHEITVQRIALSIKATP